jgi:hypothetical protein
VGSSKAGAPTEPALRARFASEHGNAEFAHRIAAGATAGPQVHELGPRAHAALAEGKAIIRSLIRAAPAAVPIIPLS